MTLRGRVDLRTIAWNAALFLAYLVAARLALSLATVGGAAALVWPSSGIALAAVLALGKRVLPAVFFAELAVMQHLENDLLVGIPIALGDTLDAAAGAWLFRLLSGSSVRCDSLRHALSLIAVAALTPVLSATIAVTSLAVGEGLSPDLFVATYRAWWVGNALGVLIVSPLLLSWGSFRLPRVTPLHAIELAALGSLLLIACVVVFLRTGRGDPLQQPYAFFPLFIWAAYRFGLVGAATATAVVATFALWATVRGFGPFAADTLAESLLRLQSFLGCAALAPLVLAGAVADRQRAVRARDDFIAVAAHELRTPLTALEMQLELLERAIKKDPGAPVLDRVHKIVGSSRRLERLVNQLLDVSRITAGRLHLDPEPVDLGALVREVAARVGEGNTPVVVSGVEEVRGRWDRLRLDQVVANLVGNAVKYGHGKPVEVELQQDGDAILRVTDHGIGIEPERQKRLFQKFERAVGREFGGFGLGLWITRQIVEACGGSIQLWSEVGQGSVFTVRLPLEPEVTS